MKTKLIPIIALSSVIMFSSFFGPKDEVVNQEESVIIETSVRMPTPKLCPSRTKYYTDCVGDGMGCDMTDCGQGPIIRVC